MFTFNGNDYSEFCFVVEHCLVNKMKDLICIFFSKKMSHAILETNRKAEKNDEVNSE